MRFVRTDRRTRLGALLEAKLLAGNPASAVQVLSRTTKQ